MNEEKLLKKVKKASEFVLSTDSFDDGDTQVFEEYCENCKKKITKEMKEKQNVVYASAEHTLDENLCDDMFGGVFCSWECYEEMSGINLVRKLATQTCLKDIVDIIKKFPFMAYTDYEIGKDIEKDLIKEIEKQLNNSQQSNLETPNKK